MEYKMKYNFWLQDDYFDEQTKKELMNIKDEKEIQDRFYKELDFGTGGLRGIIGAGTNRLNIYTIRKATQGFANYIIKQGQSCINKGVAIAYDSRYLSKEFAEQTALVLNGNGIKTYLFDGLRPVPMLSFAVRELKCTAGIVITASHNPKDYNGYKVYWEDGGQVQYPRDNDIIKFVNDVNNYKLIKIAPQQNELFNIISDDIDEKFNDIIKEQIVNKELIERCGKKLKVVYTPLHGSGSVPVKKVLEDVGFTNLFIVKEQEEPDYTFPTVKYPNPEDPQSFDLAVKLAKTNGADIILGTDPDADRLGVVVKDGTGTYIPLKGNEIGLLIVDYILSQKHKQNKLPKNGVVMSSIVSTKLTREITKFYGIEFIEVLTGFKYIGEKMNDFEASNEYEFICGFEESYGYLVGTHAHDKDAVVASMLICEVATHYMECNMTLYEGMQEIYKKYGFFREDSHSITLKGVDGNKKINAIMENLRSNAPKEVNKVKVKTIIDYKNKTIKNLKDNTKSTTKLPISDVLYFEMEDRSWFCVRPSGTEPKIKIYFGVVGVNENDASNRMEKLVNRLKTIFD